MIGFLMILMVLAILLYPVFDLFFLINKLKKASGWIPVSATVKDIRIIKKQIIKNRFLSKYTIYFFCEGKIDGIRYGYTNLTLYNKVNAHQRQIAKKLSCGKEVKIYVDPKNPHIGCYLNPKEHKLTMGYIKLFSIWFIIGLMWFFLGPTG